MSPSDPAGTPEWNRPSTRQAIAAFAVAVIVLAVLLAGALLGWVPRQFSGDIFKLGVAVAGAGFAVFLIGYFDYQSKGLRIGGPLGVFVLLMIINPGRNVPDYISEYLNKSFQTCRANVQSQQYDVASADCAKAAAELPQSGTAMHWFALCQYNQEQYHAAISSWKRAVELGYEPARVNYDIAFAYFRLGQYGDAAKHARLAVDESSGNSALTARAWFMVADAELSQWNFGSGSDQHFADAVEAFQSFLEIGTPKFKARAELACILAVKGQLTTDATDKERFEAEAVAAFSSALSELSAYKMQDSAMQRSSFADTYEASSSPCGTALDKLWLKQRPDENYETLLVKVRG